MKYKGVHLAHLQLGLYRMRLAEHTAFTLQMLIIVMHYT